jgi:hypothetical protein
VDLKVTRQQLRGCISRVDSVGRQQRKHKAVKRRVYEVEGPHHLWHINGHHKLMNYGLVTHGCIDGYSRAIMYMRCTDNNQAATTLRLFQGACLQYMLPSRVRGDRGGENIRIADTVIQHRHLYYCPSRKALLPQAWWLTVPVQQLERDERHLRPTSPGGDERCSGIRNNHITSSFLCHRTVGMPHLQLPCNLWPGNGHEHE